MSTLLVISRLKHLNELGAKEILLDSCNRWNKNTKFLKAYLIIDSKGTISVLTEWSLLCRYGINDAQLEQHFSNFAKGTSEFFRRMEREISDSTGYFG
ncbi:YbjN domain-containing protein [Corynebacterium caspium]|uniref:YbjN domain-containing protein n=1 Tax=Corynebacterium caspium TaxID=234828 RepID=UPI000382E9C4|nr:YbjN domain-containing protein [Corynebacterium caspium]WKD58601.1 hypothetical protein CCASP_00870 [Corynebacterium caspium DSM 44850]